MDPRKSSWRRLTVVGTSLAVVATLTVVYQASASENEAAPPPAADHTQHAGHAGHGNAGKKFAAADLPAGDPGTSQRLIGSDPEGIPRDDESGAFRTVCDYTHMNNDDPIVYPGQPGASHLHSFWGNTSLNAYTTADNIRNNGNSACQGGIANRTGYWVPSMIDASGNPVEPIHSGDWQRAGQLGYEHQSNVFYYKTFADRNVPVVAPPTGFRMIVGDAKATGVTPDQQGQYPRIGFKCDGQGNAQPYGPGEIPVCDRSQMVTLVLNFPDCWDGVNLDSPDHKSHVAYGGAECPSSHPKRIPTITYNIRWPVWDYPNSAGWRLSSDMYSTSSPGGYSAHADWMNGWEPEVLQTFVQKCLTERRNCEVDRLGQGEKLYR